uniref:Uncharacterized protein n=1 Tax=Pseudomonas syringae pv. actinidiae TaxID=103796 RepID=A0A2P0QFT4_PSESF|nr:hypothetical protein [Pseudomonas syringae pv. actinidiae]
MGIELWFTGMFFCSLVAIVFGIRGDLSYGGATIIIFIASGNAWLFISACMKALRGMRR